MTYCTDTDLLHWEPDVFRDAAFASQLQLAGSGDLDGTTFTISSGSFADAGVAAGQVIVLSGAISGSYAIVSVDSATELTLSVMYDGLFPDSGDAQPCPVGTASGLGFAIRTFFPQRKVTTDLLRRIAGIGPESRLNAAAAIVNTESLRRPCVLGTLHMIYNALAAAAEEPKELAIRADLYERLYRRALAQTRVEIDLNGDGKGELVRQLNILEWRRT